MKRAFWIWNIPQCEKGDPLAIAAEAVKAGLSDVFIKVADGAVRFGIYNKVNAVPPVAAALKAVGVRVWGWQYVYGKNAAAEEKVATQRIKELGLYGFIVDAESEFKVSGMDKVAESYLSKLKENNPGVVIAFSSYRFPHYHPEFPWKVFYKYCDINMPQVYWEQARNASQQTRVCIDKFKAMGGMPIWPVGAAYKWNGWQPTLAEVQGFDATAERNGIELVSYWSWEHCRRDLPELWPKPIIVPPPPGDDRLTRIEKKVLDLDKVLTGLAQVVTELKSILSK